MSWPKLLPSITVPTGGYQLVLSTSVGVVTTVLASGEYESFLHLGEELRAQVAAGSDPAIDIVCPFPGTVDRVAINRSGSFRFVFSQTDQALYSMLGYTGATSTGSTLYAELRHLYGWYAPTGVGYPGTEREIPRRYQPTAAGGAVLVASPATYQYRRLRFTTLLEPQIEPYAATTAGDGYGNNRQWDGRTFVDFWTATAGAKFLYYEDADDGSFSTPGTEGAEYVTCVRTDERLNYNPIDDGYTYFDLELPLQIVGGN